MIWECSTCVRKNKKCYICQLFISRFCLQEKKNKKLGCLEAMKTRVGRIKNVIFVNFLSLDFACREKKQKTRLFGSHENPSRPFHRYIWIRQKNRVFAIINSKKAMFLILIPNFRSWKFIKKKKLNEFPLELSGLHDWEIISESLNGIRLILFRCSLDFDAISIYYGKEIRRNSKKCR